MNNLQLYITKSYDGFQNMLEINQEDAIKQQVYDLSPAVKGITYDPERINIFYMLRYTDEGVFVVILRTIAPREADHLAAWIFVPSSINVPENDLQNVVTNVVDIISNSRITSDQFGEMRRLFSKEYEPMPSPASTVANMGQKYAYRYYGNETGYEIGDFLGNKKYQTSYLPYAGVILAKKDEAPAITGQNLTDEPLEQMVKIFPPKLVSNLYMPIIFGKPFTKPFLVPLMGTVEILWESSTAVDVHQSIMISKPNMRPEPIAASILPAKTVTPVQNPAQELPAAKDNDAEPQIISIVTGTPGIEDNEATTPAETPVIKAAETTETNADANLDAQDIRKVIHDRQHLYNFEIPAKSADISGMIKFEVRTRTELNGSPIDGYDLSGPIQEGESRSNHLVYTPQGGMNNKIIFAAAGFVVGILLTLLCTCAFGSSSTKEDNAKETTDSIAAVDAAPEATDTPVQAGAEAEAAVAKDTSLEAAIRYLDTNKNKWEKSELESYPDLKGLYNDMNTFNKKRLIEYWGPKLKDSRQFSTIAKHAKLGMKKKPRVAKPGQKTYNTENESSIRIQNYLNTIDP